MLTVYYPNQCCKDGWCLVMESPSGTEGIHTLSAEDMRVISRMLSEAGLL